uniref:Uncharacterized protein n=1 Tax=Globisporangium ultimum (strain ATCC 200006 / CBS 805.95 / DAOM BR144) TaxID=431595 RepID=K3WUV4_GLOUD
MGFHIPDSPPRTNALSQTGATTDGSTASGTVPQFSERFSPRVARRRNAIVPTLFIDVIGSPRPPHVCLSRENRLAFSQNNEQQEQAREAAAMSRSDSAATAGPSSDHAYDSRAPKRAPGIRRRSDQADQENDAFTSSRAWLNAHDTP